MKTLENKPIYAYILIAILLFLAFSIFVLKNNKNNADANIHITIDGKNYIKNDEGDTIDLNKDMTFTIKTDLGYNVVEIKNKNVSVIESDCPDKICIKKGKLNTDSYSDMIVCAPHRLLISIY